MPWSWRVLHGLADWLTLGASAPRRWSTRGAARRGRRQTRNLAVCHLDFQHYPLTLVRSHPGRCPGKVRNAVKVLGLDEWYSSNWHQRPCSIKRLLWNCNEVCYTEGRNVVLYYQVLLKGLENELELTKINKVIGAGSYNIPDSWVGTQDKEVGTLPAPGFSSRLWNSVRLQRTWY